MMIASENLDNALAWWSEYNRLYAPGLEVRCDPSFYGGFTAYPERGFARVVRFDYVDADR